ncbi:bifunctional diguanylate cyclase/phosphodiesterase [Cereibacter sphaeroides]|uniref:putative bifunctional diguanylate cyclase/phosphodiesterase n=1 Tax=Cereibacter sphaeroides TaxID=1063 RepID=UPI001F2ACE4D|nr:bifunctional diguanylate cyclase/phosphodiesterase [Cereibacter sphaeroides]MCE6949663.1 bifunctional diguanylate cyclase/phosphodiesterase [Cereibacter sphaeroides]
MEHEQRSNAPLGRIIAPILTIMVLVTCAVVVLARESLREIDADAVEMQKAFARRGITAEMTRLPQEQQVSAIWDEAVHKVREDDKEWMAGNLGVWMQTYYGHDENYIVAPDGRVVYAARDKRTVEDLQREQGLSPPLPVLIARLRTLMRKAAKGAENPATAISGLSVVEPIRLGDHAAIASATPIVPDSDDLVQAPGTEYLHIAVQYLDAATALRLGQEYGLSKAEFVSEPRSEGERITLPVAEGAGDLNIWLSWEPDRPGHRLVEKMGPVTVLFGLFCMALLLALLGGLRHSARLLRKSEADARFLASHDPLSGLPNRRHFEESLVRALAAEQAGGPSVTVLSVDLDHFKEVNDTLSHAAGDELIKQVSARLRYHVRATDVVARLGGDEFALLLFEVGNDSLPAFCAGLVHVLSQPWDLAEGRVFVSASIGVARSRDLNADAEAMLRAADAALHAAKAEGMGRFCIFTLKMDDALRQRRGIERGLRAALESGEGLDLVFQPVFDTQGRIAMVEALVRWTSSGGNIGPEVFIGVAEESGLILDLGRWILERSCSIAVAAGIPRIAVNVSAVQLRSEAFVADVMTILERTGLPAHRLELELTERCALDAGPVTKANLRALREKGISVALDDFATGQSLLQYVRDYEIDMIKIDKSFVQRLGRDDGSEHIVRVLVELARAMGLDVVAEGVETEAQRDALVNMGCRLLQGYLLAKPMPAAALGAYTYCPDLRLASSQPPAPAAAPGSSGPPAGQGRDATLDGDRAAESA